MQSYYIMEASVRLQPVYYIAYGQLDALIARRKEKTTGNIMLEYDSIEAYDTAINRIIADGKQLFKKVGKQIITVSH